MVQATMIVDQSSSPGVKDSSGSEQKPSLAYKFSNSFTRGLDRVIWSLDGSATSESVYLTGNFAPVDKEVHEQVKVISGALPEGLNGAFVRTGPNPYFQPEGRYHWFDGDGMAHVVRFKDGVATYCNRWVDTNRLKAEKKAGYAAGGKIGDNVGFSGLMHLVLDRIKRKLGVLASEGNGTANTALAFHAGKLLMLHEGDLPYSLRIACDGLVSTIGRIYSGDLTHSFTAHPKVDPVTQEMFAFGYSVENKPYLWFVKADASGKITTDIPVPLPEPIMMHDFAITDRHAIFLDVPLVFTPQAMVKEKRLPFTFKKDRPTRFGVLDRNATDSTSIKWFETDPCMIFHVSNAWENNDNNTIELYACCFNDFNLDSFTAIKDSDPYLSRIILDMTTGKATRERLSPLAGDFPVVPAALVGRKTKYTYVGAMETDCGGVPKFYGIAKVDLTAQGQQDSLAGLIKHGEGRLGGEAMFVPSANGTEEDDGYLMTFVYDDATSTSQLVVYDAKSMSDEPVAVLQMPQRVPYGFHCTWVTEEQMKELNASA